TFGRMSVRETRNTITRFAEHLDLKDVPRQRHGLTKRLNCEDSRRPILCSRRTLPLDLRSPPKTTKNSFRRFAASFSERGNDLAMKGSPCFPPTGLESWGGRHSSFKTPSGDCPETRVPGAASLTENGKHNVRYLRQR
ncbi:hypothetical protein BaRGS_00035683, partial [Batillaria attramentaria]